MVRVVLVDDSDAVRGLLRKTLEDEDGIKVVGEADCGEDALALVAETMPDMAIVDCAMPGIDGAETTKRLLSSFPQIRVVGFSADPSNERPMRVAGAIAFVVKGAPTQDLVATLRLHGPAHASAQA